MAKDRGARGMGDKGTPEERRRSFKRLGKYLFRYPVLFLTAIALMLAVNFLELLGPKLSGVVIDAIGILPSDVQFNKVFYYSAILLVLYIISSISSYLLSLVMVRLSQKVVKQMRKDVFDKLLDLPVGYFDTHSTGDIISRVSYDIDTVNASLANDVLQLGANFITVIGSLYMMLRIAPPLLIVFLITIPASLMYTKYRTNKIRPLFRKRSAKLGELNGFVEEMVTAQKTIKVYNREEYVKDKFHKLNKEAVDSYYESDYYGSITGPVVTFINNTSLALIGIYGSLLFVGGRITIGNLSSFILYSRKFSGPINEFANILGEIQSAFAAAERVFRLIDQLPEPPDSPKAKELTDISGQISLDNVTFGYREDLPVLKNITVDVKAGSVVAIVGPTGVGKTTLINLLMRFYDVDSGNIYIDGINICDVTRKSLRTSFGMVLQDTWLFGGTIRDNIAYGRPDATFEEVEAAAKAALLHRDIMMLPQGYDTNLSEDGIQLSQGQKQLLTIARAMLLKAKILILDEATSNIDTRTEAKIQEAMLRLMEGHTCFVIAHRLSTIHNADIILVMKEGEIAEKGTHKELLANNGIYAELYNSQFE